MYISILAGITINLKNTYIYRANESFSQVLANRKFSKGSQ